METQSKHQQGQLKEMSSFWHKQPFLKLAAALPTLCKSSTVSKAEHSVSPLRQLSQNSNPFQKVSLSSS